MHLPECLPKEHELMLHLTGTSELRRKKEPNRLDLVLICRSVGCNVCTAMSTCTCRRTACKRPLCRWPNLAQASERTASNDKNPRRSRPPRRTQQCPRRYLLRDPHHLLHQEQSREPQPRASPANTPPISNLKSLIGIVHAPCFMFRNGDFLRGPGGKSGSTPGAKLWAPSRGLSKIVAL